MAYRIMTDSCCDLPAELAEQLQIEVLPLSLLMGDQSYRNYLDGREIGFHEFYEQVKGGQMPTTSAVSVGDFEDAFRRILSGGEDLLMLAFSSGLSTTYQSACIAADTMAEEFPQRKVLVVDTLCASMGQGLMVWLCAKEAEKGVTLEQLRDYAEFVKGRVCHWFTVDDLNHLKRGGRISAATALVGTMLSIKPVLHVDKEGHLISMSKARGRKASLLALVDQMEQTAVNPAEQTVFISHGDCLEDAEFVAEEIRRRMGTEKFAISYVGPVIGSHTGPGVVALFYVGKER